MEVTIMEKISRILPSSPRLGNTDLRNSGVARPGTPSFGRPVGVSALAKPSFDGMAKATDELKEFQTERAIPKSMDPKAEIVNRMSSEFFMKRTAAPTVEDSAAIDELLTKYHDEDSDLNPVTAKIRESLDDDAPVIGGNLDIIA
jgi:hypothetical protein